MSLVLKAFVPTVGCFPEQEFGLCSELLYLISAAQIWDRWEHEFPRRPMGLLGQVGSQTATVASGCDVDNRRRMQLGMRHPARGIATEVGMKANTFTKQLLIATMVVTTSACNLDPYADKFRSQLTIGDSRSRAIEVMGPPASVITLELPFARFEHLAWKSLNGHVYVVHAAAERIVTKTVIH